MTLQRINKQTLGSERKALKLAKKGYESVPAYQNFIDSYGNCSPQQKSLIEKHYKQHQLSQQKYKPCDLA